MIHFPILDGNCGPYCGSWGRGDSTTVRPERVTCSACNYVRDRFRVEFAEQMARWSQMGTRVASQPA